jgi:hypothetical protein
MKSGRPLTLSSDAPVRPSGASNSVPALATTCEPAELPKNSDAVGDDAVIRRLRTHRAHGAQNILQGRGLPVILIAIDEREDGHAVVGKPLREFAAADVDADITSACGEDDGGAVGRAGLGRGVKQLRMMRVHVDVALLRFVGGVGLDVRHALRPEVYDFLAHGQKRIQQQRTNNGGHQRVGHG